MRMTRFISLTGIGRRRAPWLGGLLAAVLCAGAFTARASTIQITYTDGPSEGFNDPTVYTQPPYSAGSPTTLGAARRAAFEAAAGVWGCTMSGTAPITISASMDSLGGDGSGAIAGQAGSTYVSRDFSGAPVAGTWYAAPLAAQIRNFDPQPGTPMIDAVFNSDIDGPVVLGNVSWYYGTDGNTGGNANFFQVVLHEFGHGMGFLSFLSSTGDVVGAPANAFPAAYDRFLMDGSGPGASLLMNKTVAQRAADLVGGSLFFNGTRVRAANNDGRSAMFAPNPYQPGSSTSHLDQATFQNAVNSLMCPVVSNVVADAGPVGNGVFRDIGWVFTVTPDDKNVITGQNIPVGVTLTATDTKSLPVTFHIIRNPAHGTLTGSGANRTYTPNSGYIGPDSFAYTADDGCATSPAAVASITVASWVPTGAGIPARFGMGSLLATQTRSTGFGNNLSELDQLFARSDGAALNIGLTGNIENNGNGAVILLDTKSGGSSSFNYTGAGASARINELNGDTLDTGFEPDYAVDVNNSGGTLYVDLYDLQANTKTFLGSAAAGGGAAPLTGGGAAAFDNSNLAGVSDTAAVDAAGYPLAAGATTGVELSLPLSQVGAAGSAARLMAVVIGNGGFVSNQVLPGLPDTTPNLGNGPTNYQSIAGDQNAQVGLAVTANELNKATVPWAYTPVYLSGSANVDAHPPVTSAPTVFNNIAYVAEDVVDAGGNHTANIVAINAKDNGTAHLVTAFGTNGRVTGLDAPVVGRVSVYYALGVPRLYAMTTRGTLYMMDAATGGNMHSAAVFSGGTSVSTPAVSTLLGIPTVIVAGKTSGGVVQLAKVTDVAVPVILPTLTLTGATDVASSPSVIADGSRVQIATVNGATGAVYTVDTATFTVFNQANLPTPALAAPTLTTDPPGYMLIGISAGPGGLFYAFNASNASVFWQVAASAGIRDAAYVDYRATPNHAFVGTTGTQVLGFPAHIGTALLGFPGITYPAATGTPVLLKPSLNGPDGTLYLPTTGGMYAINPDAPGAAGAVRFPISARLTSPSVTGAAFGDIMAAGSTNGAGTTGTTGPTGFTGGNVYGLAVQS